MQTLNLQVTLPETHVIITKNEYNAYLDYKEQLPVNMTLPEVARKFGCSTQWFREHVINQDYFRRKITSTSSIRLTTGGIYND